MFSYWLLEKISRRMTAVNSWTSFVNLTQRNFKIFFKNKIQLFYTLLVPIILIIIYILFLRSMELNMVVDILKKSGAPTDDPTLNKYLGALMDSWMIGGIVALSSITMAIQTDAIIVKDKENGINRDFASSPVSKNSLIFSYFVFNYLLTFALCLIVLLICLAVLAIMGEFMLTFGWVMAAIGLLALVVIPSTLLTVLVCTFIHHDNTLAAVVAIFSTVSGFVIGSYMPLGMMPVWAQSICCIFPGTYSTSLMRFSLMDTPLHTTEAYLRTIMSSAKVDDLMSQVNGLIGYNLKFAQFTIQPWVQIIVVVGFILVLGFINVLTSKNLILVESGFNRKKKKK